MICLRNEIHQYLISKTNHTKRSLFPLPIPTPCPLNQLLQFSAQLEHFGALTASVSTPLTAVMGHKTAQMAVTRLDAVVSSC